MRNAYLYPSISNNLKCAIGVFQGKRAFTGPHTVMIDIEDNCDLNCIMCYFHSPMIEKKEEFQRLNYDTYTNILKDLKGIGTRKISICGRGEPFLHPEIGGILELTKDMGFYANIFTNGIRARNFLTEIYQLDQIIFSLHAGDRETYHKVHPQAEKGYFEHIRYVLGQIRDYKHKNKKSSPWVKIINVIFSQNCDKIEEMFHFAEEFKVNEILFKPVQLSESRQSLKINPEQLNYLIKRLKRWRNYKIKHNIPEYLATIISSASVAGDKRMTKKESKKSCYIPWYQSVVLTDGNVVACPYNQAVLGNINNNSFRKIWFSSEYNRFRQTLDCGNCAANAVYPHLLQFKNLFPWKRRR